MGESITVTTVDEILVAVICSARLFDPGIVDHVERHLRRAVDERRHVVLDLTAVRFISSAMLGRLILLWQDLTACERRMAACGANSTISEILRISGLDERIDLCVDAKQALQAVRGNRP